jgi:hypothetical protein
MSDLVAEVGLGRLFHLYKDHGADFLGSLKRKGQNQKDSSRTKGPYKVAELSLVLDGNGRFAILLGQFEGPVLDVAFDVGIADFASD